MAFDAKTYKSTTRQQWQDAAEAWNAWGKLLGEWLGPATEAMLDMAAIGKGSRVLDVAAGAGQQSLVAARRVGPTGYVLATDISPNILEYAEENARIEGLDNLATLAADGEELDVEEEQLRRGDFAGGDDLFPRPAAGTGKHQAGVETGRTFFHDRLFDARQERLFLKAGFDHPRARQAAAAGARPAGAVQPGQPRRAGRRLETGGLPRRRRKGDRRAGNPANRCRLRPVRREPSARFIRC